MPLSTTLVILVASLTLAALAWHMQRRPRETLDPPLPIPWTFLQILGVVLALVAAAHLISLGTGQPFKGRFGF
ncbi:MAG: hypothetical protein P1U88_05670 [Thalassobaculaceae bacterium]|nr:hypothetical protein [Thalassobaculaceae bacterium]